jgi:hypothetical protein
VQNSLITLLKLLAEPYHINFKSSDADVMFGELIINVARQEGKVVILIDEYDRTLVDNYDDTDLQNAIRKFYRDFYYKIKACEKYIHAVYITGISKYTKMGVFSAANNITDFSNEEHFSTMFGYTHEEIIANFKHYIKDTVEFLHMSRDDFLEKLKSHYDGYAFSENDALTVYNPTSVQKFFLHKKFGNYWSKTGSREFIERYIKSAHLTMADFEHYNITADEVEMPGEIMQSLAPALFLYQSGYLTPRREGDEPDEYYLTYPNIEVRTSIIKQIQHNFFTEQQFLEKRRTLRRDALQSLKSTDYIGLLSVFNALFSEMLYDDYNAAARDPSHLECFYRNDIYRLLQSADLDIRPEEHKVHGRADLVLHHDGRILLLELKVAQTGTRRNLQAKLREADAQMSGYAGSYRNPIRICSVISGRHRRIALASVGTDVYMCAPDANGRKDAQFEGNADRVGFVAAPWLPPGKTGPRSARRK